MPNSTRWRDICRAIRPHVKRSKLQQYGGELVGAAEEGRVIGLERHAFRAGQGGLHAPLRRVSDGAIFRAFDVDARHSAEARCGGAHRSRERTERLGLQKGALKRETRTLSGGNQQKLVLAKWLEMKMAVLLVDEPTRGVDVGAKVELFAVLEGLAKSGVAVVMVSSELEEVMDNSDRVLVLSRGILIGEVEGRTTSKDDVVKMIFAAENVGGGQHT